MQRKPGDQPCSPRRALLLLNSQSRAGGGSLAEASILALEAGGVELVRRPISAQEDVTDVIRNLAGVVDAIVVGGGDGSVNAVLEGALATQLPLGILPLGTANDLARTLGIPPDPVAAASIIQGGYLRQIDLGRVNGHLFANVASLGLSVELTRRLTGGLKRRWGRLGYPIAAAQALIHAKPFVAEVRCGQLSERMSVRQIAVGNGVFYGGGMSVYEAAQIDDGCLDFYSLEAHRRWWLLPVLPFLRGGRQRGLPGVRAFCSLDPIHVRTEPPLSINTDGEITTMTPAVFEVLSRALAVFTPAPSAPTTPTDPEPVRPPS
ncbi:lipid kinase [Methylobacterium fujisawaense]|uniref:lipid kinase n=1 Tax=Methylobacterium fujisawaense TaxID=107400 RepID=UPI00313B2FE4